MRSSSKLGQTSKQTLVGDENKKKQGKMNQTFAVS